MYKTYVFYKKIYYTSLENKSLWSLEIYDVPYMSLKIKVDKLEQNSAVSHKKNTSSFSLSQLS